MNTYTREEVAKHCKKESCWVTVGNNVYSSYSHNHSIDMTSPLIFSVIHLVRE